MNILFFGRIAACGLHDTALQQYIAMFERVVPHCSDKPRRKFRDLGRSSSPSLAG